jgi:1,2-diacylglycerol 3-beta-galactosyltransferase
MLTLLAVGSRRVERLVDTLNVVNHFGRPLQIAVVAGKDEKLYRELSEMDWHVPVKLYEYVQNVVPLMKAADFIVCKAGGLVITEALACARPLMLVEVIPGQETGNAEYVVVNGAGDLAREPVEVLETLSHWLMDDGALLHSRNENARRLGRPNAAYEVASAVWLAAEHAPAQRSPRGTGRLRLVDLLSRNHVPWEEDSSTQGD